MHKIFFLLLFPISALIYGQSEIQIRGADLSFSPQIEDYGGIFYSNGISKDVLDIFRENGANYIRLRLWHTPADGYCGLEKTIEFAKRAKAKGYKFLLDIHYSDSWADPGQQNKPAAWSNLEFNNLLDSVYSYTKRVISAFRAHDVTPDMVQPGNEITNGMLWPEGKNNSSAGWNRLGSILRNAVSGIMDGAGGIPVKIMLHIDSGADNSKSVWWLDNIINQGIGFDVIGLSYYPWWHGALDGLNYNLNDLAVRYGREIIIVETAYPWTLSWSDNFHNSVGSPSQLLSGYPATVQGQLDFMNTLKNTIRSSAGSKVSGFFYWAPDWISLNNAGSGWENLTFFDFNGAALSSIAAFNAGSSSTSVPESLPVSFSLYQNYPNPFNPSTTIKFTVPELKKMSDSPARIQIKIYDLTGKEITALFDGYKSPGTYTLNFNAANLPAGIYFCALRTGGITLTRKLALIK